MKNTFAVIFMSLSAIIIQCGGYIISDPAPTPILSDNADLLSFTLSTGDLVPEFDPAITSYQCPAHTGFSTTVIATIADSRASAKWYLNAGQGGIVESGVPFLVDHMKIFYNDIEIKVTAENGDYKFYSVLLET